MKTVKTLAIGLILSTSAFAQDARLVGRWITNCVPADGHSMQFRSVIYRDGRAQNDVVTFGNANCSGSGTATPSVHQVIAAVPNGNASTFALTAIDVASVPQAQPYSFGGEISFPSPRTLSIKYKFAILNVNGQPQFAPQAQLDAMSSLVWNRF